MMAETQKYLCILKGFFMIWFRKEDKMPRRFFQLSLLMPHKLKRAACMN